MARISEINKLTKNNDWKDYLNMWEKLVQDNKKFIFSFSSFNSKYKVFKKMVDEMNAAKEGDKEKKEKDIIDSFKRFCDDYLNKNKIGKTEKLNARYVFLTHGKVPLEGHIKDINNFLENEAIIKPCEIEGESFKFSDIPKAVLNVNSKLFQLNSNSREKLIALAKMLGTITDNLNETKIYSHAFTVLGTLENYLSKKAHDHFKSELDRILNRAKKLAKSIFDKEKENIDFGIKEIDNNFNAIDLLIKMKKIISDTIPNMPKEKEKLESKKEKIEKDYDKLSFVRKLKAKCGG